MAEMTDLVYDPVVRLRLGVAGGPLPNQIELLTPSVARDLAEIGITAVVTHLNPHPTAMSVADARRIRTVLADYGISIVQAAGYRTNLIEPDDERRRAGISELGGVLANANEMGAEMFLTGCGSHHPSRFYGAHPDNHSTPARARLIDSLHRVASIAEAADASVALECHLATTLNTAENIREILDEVGSNRIKANFDPVNLLGDLQSVYHSGAVMSAMAKTMRPHLVPCAHAKDVIVLDGHPLQLAEAAPGQGHVDYDAFFAVCRELGPDTAVVVEHLPAQDAVAALEFMTRAASRCGVAFG